MIGRTALIAILLAQFLSALFFVGNMLSGIIGFSPVSWEVFEFIEIGAAIGLILGIGLGAWALSQSLRKTARVEAKLRAASTEFMVLLEERFDEWRLTPAERDVALFSIKGLSTVEIAALRDTSKGTVKAQTNAIYRKAGVSGRSQLLSLFIEDLMDGSAQERLGKVSSDIAET